MGVTACLCDLRNVGVTGAVELLQITDEFFFPGRDKAKANSKIIVLSEQGSGRSEGMKAPVLILWQPLLSTLSLEEVPDHVQVCKRACIQRSCTMEIEELDFVPHLAF